MEINRQAADILKTEEELAKLKEETRTKCKLRDKGGGNGVKKRGEQERMEKRKKDMNMTRTEIWFIDN